jgi:nicotinamidase-related amidase
MKTALLVIDVQQALIDARPTRLDEFLINIKMLVDAAHKGGTEVIYVRHDGGAGSELESGTAGWQLDRSLAPRLEERVFDKRFNSAFRKTGLHQYLEEQEITRLVICGMQIEFCVDTSVKVAFEFGYEVFIPSGATATYDNLFFSGDKIAAFYEHMIWHEPLASVVTMEEAVELLN